jgi:hypothetical protein
MLTWQQVVLGIACVAAIDQVQVFEEVGLRLARSLNGEAKCIHGSNAIFWWVARNNRAPMDGSLCQRQRLPR